jgi:hypothetical protein
MRTYLCIKVADKTILQPRPILSLSKFPFLPPDLSFVTIITQFNKNSFWLPHLVNFVPDFTPFKIYEHFLCDR